MLPPDTTGRLVRSLMDGYAAAGTHRVVWNGCDDAGRSIGSGVYIVRLDQGTGVMTKRITLLK